VSILAQVVTTWLFRESLFATLMSYFREGRGNALPRRCLSAHV
jgi:hypothetical protein